jgi:hypothetical protein
MICFKEELEYINSEEFKLGEYLYMGMGTATSDNTQKVCLSVGYKIDYAFRKAIQFEQLNSDVVFRCINKVKVGELVKSKEFIVTEELKQNCKANCKVNCND